MNQAETTDYAPLPIVLSEAHSTISKPWLDALGDQFQVAPLIAGPGRAGAEFEHLPDSSGPWWHWLERLSAARGKNGVVLIAAGLELPRGFHERLNQLLSGDQLPALLGLPGNHEDAFNPWLDIDSLPAPAVLDALVNAAADERFAPIAQAPERLAIITPGQVDAACKLAAAGKSQLYDAIWIHDPEYEPAAGQVLPPELAAACGHLRLALSMLGDDERDQPLPLFGAGGRSVVLHISHDWGGGVARWISDIVAADTEHDHLVLSSSGHSDGKIHGQHLKLYAAGPGRGLVRRWTLSPAIADTEVSHGRYRALLEHLISRYGIDRIVVSSLIGHSLDALASGLPTLTVLHDFYPAWPVLDRDPLDYTAASGDIDIERALKDSAKSFLFASRDAAHWQHLAQQWLARVDARSVQLMAPTEQVVERWRRLSGDPLDQARIVPHGYRGWPKTQPQVEPRRLDDGRLNLVVVGRLSPGKGLELLDQALPGLRDLARITLLGCGHHGMRFLGRPGVDIVLDYEHHRLPEQLARIGAQAALFLSTVAETWNYVLSETRALGLVPVATRSGSFVERLRDGVDGLLFDPRPDALIAAVSELHKAPQRLAAMRKELPGEPDASEQLKIIAGLSPGQPTAQDRPKPAEAQLLQAHALAAELSDATAQVEHLDQRRQRLEQDLAERAEWARRYERLSKERTAWAQRADRHLVEAREVHETVRHDLEQKLSDRQQTIESLDKELRLAHARAQQLNHQLETTINSRSMKLTRPLRVVSRLASNARHYRIWHPGQWQGLLLQLIDNWRRFGPGGAVHRLHRPPVAVEPVAQLVAEARSDPEFAQDPVTIEPATKVRASIIIPVFNKVGYTANCLNSLVRHTPPGNFEVIVVDDCSSDDTQEYLGECQGIRTLRNRRNSGFIHSCNAGAAAARGDYLVFLNNDTSVTPGWLQALIDPLTQDPETGIVGGRLVYPDGRLQEAGGIIFSDGSGWNYGRGQNADLPQYNFLSEADYVSGACLAIARKDFERLGGFDKRYAPAYYEDTDLCFAMRQLGRKVIYQPAATIVHHEGISSGTDETSGTKRYQAINREKFREKWSALLATHPSPGEVRERTDPVRHIRFRRSPKRLLLIDAVTPQPDHDSGSVRIVAIMELLRDMGYQVSFMAQNMAWISRYSEALQQAGIEVLHAPPVHRIEDWLQEHGADLDVVFVSRHYVLAPMLKLIRRTCGQARLIFDTVDLHYLREQRQAEIAPTETLVRQAAQTRSQELALINRADVSLVVSSVEKSLLEQEAPGARVAIVSNVHEVHASATPWSDRKDLMFVGGFQHEPNVDAAHWLIREIFPLVQESLPGIRLHLIGSRMPVELARLEQTGIDIHGFVPDLQPFLDGCRLSLAPLRYGAGVKGKVNQAMSHGLPVIATGCAAEGMFLDDGLDVLIADETEAFARQIVRAYNDEALWTRLSAAGLENVQQHFSVDAARQALQQVLHEGK